MTLTKLEQIPGFIAICKTTPKASKEFILRSEWEYKNLSEWQQIKGRMYNRRIMHLWQDLKNRIRVHDLTIIDKKGRSKKCEKCGKKKDIQLHHIGYDENRKLKLLCKKHHLAEHKKRVRYPNFPIVKMDDLSQMTKSYHFKYPKPRQLPIHISDFFLRMES